MPPFLSVRWLTYMHKVISVTVARIHIHTHIHTFRRYTHNPSALWWFVYLGYHFVVCCVLGYRWYKGTVWSKTGANPWSEDDPLAMVTTEEQDKDGQVCNTCTHYIYIYIYIYKHVECLAPYHVCCVCM
jgi:hypothetical protein